MLVPHWSVFLAPCAVLRILHLFPPFQRQAVTTHGQVRVFKMHCRESLQLPLEKFFRLVDENLGFGRVVIFTPSTLPPSSSPKKMSV